MKREEVQEKALNKLMEHGYNGTICLSTGSGKSKVAIDVIKKGVFKNILITSPRTNLKENWRKELGKWNIKYHSGINWHYAYGHGRALQITIENIQTCYKWNNDEVNKFDLIIADECHLIASPEYGKLIKVARELGISVVGLTATPSLHDEEKDLFYKSYIPIVYEYYDSAKDGIVNKRKYIIYNYELTDGYKVMGGTKKSPFVVGELSQYQYLSQQIKKGQVLMAKTGSSDWFRDAANWGWGGQGNALQKSAAMTYLNAIKYRKSFLWNLSSSASIAVRLKHLILRDASNKVLLFSELTEQANKLSDYAIHSKNDEETNKNLLHEFDTGRIRELSSVNSLTLGLNLVDANYAIVESFNSSETSIKQKIGRLDRLEVTDFSTIIFIVPLQTQAEEWFKSFSKKLDMSDAVYVNNINEIKELL